MSRWVRMLFCPVLIVAGMAHGQDRFEIQVYDSETAAPGEGGVELHVNQTAEASPPLRTSHFTLEPHLGLASWCEAGGYFQTLLTQDNRFQYAGVKLRFKAKSPVRLWERIGLAVNFEISRIPRWVESSGWGSEIRPIADVRLGRLYASLNPILTFDLAGPGAGRPQFEPAAKVAVTVVSALALGGEYYAGLKDRAQVLFGAADFNSRFFDLNFGVGYGFSGEERWVVKAIVGFHPAAEGF